MYTLPDTVLELTTQKMREIFQIHIVEIIITAQHKKTKRNIGNGFTYANYKILRKIFFKTTFP